MVALRSSRRDRAPLIAVWALTLAVLAVGIAAASPILILWGALGLPGAVWLTRIHLRDTRSAPPAPEAADPAAAGKPAAAAGDTVTAERAVTAEAVTTETEKAGAADGAGDVEGESSR